MKNYSAKSIFGMLFTISLLTSCIKKDPDFKSAFKDNVDPNLFTMNYSMKTNNNATTPKVVSNVPVQPVTLNRVRGPIKNGPIPDSTRAK